MDDLILKSRWKHGPFVNDDARWGTLSGLEEVGDNSRVIQVPVAERDFLFNIGALVAPSFPGEFVAESVVSELHHEVDPDGLVSIIIIVALPDRSKGIDTELPVVTEVPSEGFHVGPVHVAAEGHALLVGLAAGLYFIASLVSDDLAIGIRQLARGVSEIEIELPVGTKGKGVNPVVVLGAADLGEECYLFVGFQVAILIGHDPDIIPGRDDNLVSKDTDSMDRINLAPLIEDCGFVSLAIAAGVLQHEDAIALRTLVTMSPVVDNLTDPDATKVIDVDAGGAEHHGL